MHRSTAQIGSSTVKTSNIKPPKVFFATKANDNPPQLRSVECGHMYRSSEVQHFVNSLPKNGALVGEIFVMMINH